MAKLRADIRWGLNQVYPVLFNLDVSSFRRWKFCGGRNPLARVTFLSKQVASEFKVSKIWKEHVILGTNLGFLRNRTEGRLTHTIGLVSRIEDSAFLPTGR